MVVVSWRSRECLLAGEGLGRLVLSQYVGASRCPGQWFDTFRVGLLKNFHVLQHLPQLIGEGLDLSFVERQAGQSGNSQYVFPGQGRAG